MSNGTPASKFRELNDEELRARLSLSLIHI